MAGGVASIAVIVPMVHKDEKKELQQNYAAEDLQLVRDQENEGSLGNRINLEKQKVSGRVATDKQYLEKLNALQNRLDNREKLSEDELRELAYLFPEGEHKYPLSRFAKTVLYGAGVPAGITASSAVLVLKGSSMLDQAKQSKVYK